MTAPITPPEWLAVGAKVAVVTYGTRTDTVRMQTVDRITAATVVVGGERYPLNRLQRSTSLSGPIICLRDPTAPEVVAIARKTAAEQAACRAEDALRKWRQARLNPELATAVRDTLAALAPYLDPAEEATR